MKRLIKRPMRALWRMTHRVRRPIIQRVEALIVRCTFQPAIPAPQVHLTCKVTEETGYLMDHMIRELVRLQTQVERLQHAVEDLTHGSTSLNVVGDLDGDDRISRHVAG